MVFAGGISVLIDNGNENAAEDLIPLAAFFVLVLFFVKQSDGDIRRSDVRRQTSDECSAFYVKLSYACRKSKMHTKPGFSSLSAERF